MKAKSVTYKTTITGIQKVRLSGRVAWDADLECYTIGGDSLEYWLERIESDQPDAHVSIEVNVSDGKEDDSKLVTEHKPLFPVEKGQTE